MPWGETIERIEENIDPSTLPADTQVIDARNRYVFPGFIDPHVHIHRRSWEQRHRRP